MKSSLPEADRHDASDTQRDDYKCEILPNQVRDKLCDRFKTNYKHMKRIGIFIFDNVELLDFAGPLEVFSIVGEIIGKSELEVFTFTDNQSPIKTIHGLSVSADLSLDHLESLDYLVIPGGDGSKQVIQNEGLMNSLEQLILKSEWTMTVCSGARIPAKLGLLADKPFCTHASVYEDLKRMEPTGIPRPDQRFVQSDKKLFSAAGISAGIDLALYLTARTFGKSLAEKTAEYMEYPMNYK
ncbi:DJ-1/PfpI family protein [Algoriphagus marincola]|uniref:DJ-1/PfpI family protein n=1 Tax=Algoriphagus marincola TaxID=264027 RepID=A0ABS7N229_9BACT|nr:DJ-1/PfpI family protein [Algoriphagus marincola]MBY5949973.1 DJ-1/PfpI family protein [Algoriphagus marincola]